MQNNTWKNKWEFKREVCRIAQELKIEQLGKIYVRPMSRKWASITSDGRTLSFNAELLDLEKELGQYVIVHELAHLRAANHGKLFKSIVRLFVPNFEEIEIKLKEIANADKD